MTIVITIMLQINLKKIIFLQYTYPLSVYIDAQTDQKPYMQVRFIIPPKRFTCASNSERAGANIAFAQ